MPAHRHPADPRHPAELTRDELLPLCKVDRTRAGGPGGQHRNRVETAIVLTHPLGHVARASERRTGRDNLRVALERMRLILAVEERASWSAASELWQTRCRSGRISVSERHSDLAPVVAEALDALAACEWDGGVAAERLGTTASQIVKLFHKHRRALERWNVERRERGLRPLR